MPDAEMIIDQWNPNKRYYRTEDVLLRSSELPFLRTRTGTQGSRRRGMTYTQEDWVDIEATSHRRLGE